MRHKTALNILKPLYLRSFLSEYRKIIKCLYMSQWPLIFDMFCRFDATRTHPSLSMTQ